MIVVDPDHIAGTDDFESDNADWSAVGSALNLDGSAGRLTLGLEGVGQTAFASARKSAWHQLGQITDECMTAQEVMSRAWLGGWEVRKIAMLHENSARGAISRSKNRESPIHVVNGHLIPG